MTIPSEQFISGLHRHQAEMLQAFDKQQARFFILEWARRHRKTTLAINLLIRECCRVPRAKYVYVAPTQVMARNIVWDDPNMLKMYLPVKTEMSWETNEQKMQVVFENGSILKIGGSDNPDALRGIDAVGAVFDEWALIKENTWSEIFRPIIAGTISPHLEKLNIFRWAMFLYTPKGVNHASLMFDSAACINDGSILPECGKAAKMKSGWYASRIDGELAGLMKHNELEQAKKDMPKVFYDQEIKCRRVTNEEMTLITSEMLSQLQHYNETTHKTIMEVRRIVSIDPAFGGDICQLKGFENSRVVAEKQIKDKAKTSEIVFAAKVLAQQLNTKNFIVDCIGVGLGVVDGLAVDEADYYVQYFNSSHAPSSNAKAIPNTLFANKRAEAYFYTAEQIRVLNVDSITNMELFRQLPQASRYKITSSGKLQIISKEKIKEELGCSPDEADCYVMGLWGLQNVEPVSDKQIEIVKFRGVHIPKFIGAK